jgi:anti-sigma B factor antagonist
MIVSLSGVCRDSRPHGETNRRRQAVGITESPLILSPVYLLMLDFHYEDRGKNDEILLIVLSGKLDTTQAEYLISVIEKQIERGHKKVVLDCDGLDYVSSMGLAMMVRLHSRMKKRGGEVRLSGVHGVVGDAIRLVKLDKMLGVYDSVEDAVEASDAA